MTVTSKGYLRIKQRGPQRDMLAHRAVILELIGSQIIERPHAPIMLPESYTVHHQDHNRRHNCPANLLCLDKPIHDSISGSYKAYLDKMKAAVDW
jgi:hypothetical protein